MKNKLLFTLSIGCILIFAGCKKDDTTAPYTNNGQYYFAGTGNASQIVPANPLDTSKGTVAFNAVYDANLQIFNYTFTWNNLMWAVTGINLYGAADSGQLAPLARNIGTYTTSTTWLPSTDTLSSTFWTYSRLSNTELTALENGQWYFVISTLNYPNGEVRGQIKLVNVIK